MKEQSVYGLLGLVLVLVLVLEQVLFEGFITGWVLEQFAAT